MNRAYDDIRERIPEPPRWWDEHAVPRYCAFSPIAVADFYADEVVLLLIECQACGMSFEVAMSANTLDRGLQSWQGPLSEQIPKSKIHYGDPPNVRCCPAGPTMNSVPRRVIEYWRVTDAPHGVDPLANWERDATLEIAIEPDWLKDEDEDALE